jgi:hypothetical protein
MSLDSSKQPTGSSASEEIEELLQSMAHYRERS